MEVVTTKGFWIYWNGEERLYCSETIWTTNGQEQAREYATLDPKTGDERSWRWRI